MSHVRQQIRDAAVTALTGLTTTGDRVYPYRLAVLRDTDLPCLLVNTDDETIDGADIHGETQERTLSLTIRACSKTATNLDDTLDTMIAEVETALAGETFGGKSKGLQLTGIRVEMDDLLERPVGIASLSYTATYYTSAGSPATAL